MSYRHLPHTADLRIEITANRRAGLFEDATQLIAELVAGTSPVGRTSAKRIEVQGHDTAELLLNYLRELLFFFATEQFVPRELELNELARAKLAGTVHGEPFDPSRHETQPEVKAVTRHQLAAEAIDSGGWRAEIVFDL